MAYREETERLRARIEELERELEGSKRRVAELEGVQQGSKRGLAERLAGGPLRIVREATVEGELPRNAHEEVVQAIRERFGVLGQTTNTESLLAWSGTAVGIPRGLDVTFSARNGSTVIRATEILDNLAGPALMGIGMVGLAFGAELVRSGALSPVAVVGLFIFIVLAARFAFSMFAAYRQQEVGRAVRDLVAITRAAIERAAAPERVRVEAEQQASRGGPATDQEHAREPAGEPARQRERS